MRFTLVDRITELVPGEKITAVKGLSIAEEYLQDHFPLFPVMPGVMMLETLYQSGSWLMRLTDDFKYSMILLAEAKSVTFKDFVEPSQSLIVNVKIQKRQENLVTMQAEGKVEGRSAVKARFVLDCFNLADRNLASSSIDAYMVSELRRDYENLCGLAQGATSGNSHC